MNPADNASRIETRPYSFRLCLPSDESTRGRLLREVLRVSNDGAAPSFDNLQMRAAKSFLGPLNNPSDLPAMVDKIHRGKELIPAGLGWMLDCAATMLLRDVTWGNTPELAAAIAQERILNGESELLAVRPADRHDLETEARVLARMDEHERVISASRIRAGESCDVVCSELGIAIDSRERALAEYISMLGPATVRVLDGGWYGDVCRDLGIRGWEGINSVMHVQLYREVLLRIRNGEPLSTVLPAAEAESQHGIGRVFMRWHLERVAAEWPARVLVRGGQSLDTVCEHLGIQEPTLRILLEHWAVDELAVDRVMNGGQCDRVCVELGVKSVLAQIKLETIVLNRSGRDRVTSGESPDEVCRAFGIRHLATHWILEMTAPGGRVLG